jgi:very-short-patch-repair endonuclease
MSDLAALGVADPAAYCAQKRVEAAEAAGMIERSVLEKWTDSVIEEDDRLKVLRPLDRDERIAQFTDLDRRLIQLSANSVIETCNARRPRNVAGVAGIIAREAQKQRRHRPVRQLMSEAAPVIQALKPCFMMSPLSVSQFLPPTMRFDVVIFDEASQVRPPDAINCIYRGRQLIVAGDQRQLPPTSFFEAVGHGDSDEWVPDEPEDFESILDVAKGCGGFSSLSLNWHYRSQHEDLITFSNYQFYQGKLITFPGSNTIGPDLGVELFVVPGVYRRGGARDNPIEVQKVVERVKHHRRNHSHLTLGVVAFSEAQASAIDAEISRHAELQDYFNDDRLQGGFVKNLETVQGDERDIIIFSVGYGPDEVGKFTMNFGPINRQGGWRRLNVAITRARRRIEVVSSVTHAKFSDATDSEGVRHLRRYLDFAGRTDNRVAALEVPLVESCGDVESPFEDEVLRTVRGWGYEVVPQAGCAGYRIDLAIRSPDRDGGFALGIECDGAMYHSSRVARDRDRLRQEVLERLGWRLHRIWGPAWYRSRAEQETRLKNAIEEATRGTAAHVAPPPVAPTGNGGSIQIDPEVPPEWTELYRPARPGPPGRNAQIYDTGPYGDLRRMVREVIATEGPVSPEVVLRRVRDAFGIQRAGSRVREAFDATVRALRTTNVVVRDPNGFLYEAGRTLTQVRRPNPSEPESIRSVAEVPRSELELAIECMVRDASAIDEDELTARVASLFGWTRRGQDIDAELRRAVRDLLRRGTIERGPHGLRPRDGS